MKINIGGLKGQNKDDDWIIFDWVGKVTAKRIQENNESTIVYNLNSGKQFPLSYNSVDAYYTSHTLEHIAPENIWLVLAEVYRTLKPECKIRIVVPDFKYAISCYQNKAFYADHSPTKDSCLPNTGLGMLMSWFYSRDKKHSSGHKMVFDAETLVFFLKNAGFEKITRKSYGDCSEIFVGLDNPRYKNWSLYFEATK